MSNTVSNAINMNGFFLKAASFRSIRRATKNSENTLSMLINPYYDLNSNLKAFAHPFYHATQLLRDVYKFVFGGIIFTGALATFNCRSAGNAFASMFWLGTSAVLNIVNTALSIVSLATRLLASIFNLGYVSTSIQSRGAHLNGAEIGGRNAETTMNMLNAFALGAADLGAKTQDEEVHQEVFNLV